MSTKTRTISTGQTVDFPASMSDHDIETAMAKHEDMLSKAEGVPLAEDPEGGTIPESEPKTAWDNFKKDIPAIAGGIGMPLIYSAKILHMAKESPKLAAMVSAGLAGAGGAIGETGQVAYEATTDDPNAPKDISEGAKRVAGAGLEQAAFDGIGNLALKAATGFARAAKPDIDVAALSLKEGFSKFGGNFTMAQMSDTWLYKQMESALRGSLTGSSVFKTADAANVKAFQAIEEHLIENITTGGVKGKTSSEIGNLFLNTIKGGQGAHTAAAVPMYEKLDAMTAGNKVNFMPVIQVASKRLEEAVRTGWKPPAAVNETISMLKDLKRVMGFKDAQSIRSDLLSMQREVGEGVGSSKAKSIINEAVSAVTKQMDGAAESMGGDVLKQYKVTDTFWRKGKDVFNDKLISKLIKQYADKPEYLAEALFKGGNVSVIMKARRAIKAAAKLNPKLDSEKMWHGMQSKYLEDMLAVTKSEAGGEVSVNPLLKIFTDPKKSRTLKAIFSKEQRGDIDKFVNLGKILQRKDDGRLGMLLKFAELGSVSSIGFTDGYGGLALPLASRTMAKLMVNPKAVDILVKMGATKAGTSKAKKLSTDFLKLTTKLGIKIGGTAATSGTQSPTEEYIPLGGA